MNIEPSAYNSLTVTPIGPIFSNNDEPKGLKGATEEDKNKAQRVGPNGSIFMGREETSPFPVKVHYE